MGLCTPHPHHLLKKVDENFNKIIYLKFFEVWNFFSKKFHVILPIFSPVFPQYVDYLVEK